MKTLQTFDQEVFDPALQSAAQYLLANNLEVQFITIAQCLIAWLNYELPTAVKLWSNNPKQFLLHLKVIGIDAARDAVYLDNSRN